MARKEWYEIILDMENGYVRNQVIAKVRSRGLAAIVRNALLEDTYNRPGDSISIR